jgi:hypothetical protein
MNVGSTCGAACAAQVQSAQGLAVLRHAMSAQKVEGQAALKLLATAQQVQGASPPPAPGAGTLVDVVV